MEDDVNTNSFTFDTLMEAKRKIDALGPISPAPEIVVTDYATKDGERFFAESLHRSKRIQKKLVKRYGGTHRQIPAMYKAGNKMLIHPVLWAGMRAKLEVRRQADYESNFYGALGGIRVMGV